MPCKTAFFQILSDFNYWPFFCHILYSYWGQPSDHCRSKYVLADLDTSRSVEQLALGTRNGCEWWAISANKQILYS